MCWMAMMMFTCWQVSITIYTIYLFRKKKQKKNDWMADACMWAVWMLFLIPFVSFALVFDRFQQQIARTNLMNRYLYVIWNWIFVSQDQWVSSWWHHNFVGPVFQRFHTPHVCRKKIRFEKVFFIDKQIDMEIKWTVFFVVVASSILFLRKLCFNNNDDILWNAIKQFKNIDTTNKSSEHRLFVKKTNPKKNPVQISSDRSSTNKLICFMLSLSLTYCRSYMHFQNFHVPILRFDLISSLKVKVP